MGNYGQRPQPTNTLTTGMQPKGAGWQTGGQQTFNANDPRQVAVARLNAGGPETRANIAGVVQSAGLQPVGPGGPQLQGTAADAIRMGRGQALPSLLPTNQMGPVAGPIPGQVGGQMWQPQGDIRPPQEWRPQQPPGGGKQGQPGGRTLPGGPMQPPPPDGTGIPGDLGGPMKPKPPIGGGKQPGGPTGPITKPQFPPPGGGGKGGGPSGPMYPPRRPGMPPPKPGDPDFVGMI